MGADKIVISVVWLLVFVFALIVYFIPAFIAERKNAKNRQSIALLNFLTGCTTVGWVAAFIWAVIDEPEKPRRKLTNDDDNPFHEPPPPVQSLPDPESRLAYTCPTCGRLVNVPLKMLGSTVTCGGCFRPFTTSPPVY